MSEDFLKNPLSLFDIRGKTAIVTGASGAFGSLASKVLAGAGANVVLAAGNAAELEKVAGECQALGGKAEAIALRPSSAANCEKIVETAVKRFGGLDILVLASGINKVSKIVDQPPETVGEHVARHPEALLEVLEATHAQEGVANHEQRPAITYHLEGPGDRAQLLVVGPRQHSSQV